MKLDGSCHCAAVRFSVEAYAPVPYMLCYCSICRKTAGGGGYAINLGAWRDTLEVEGMESVSVYRARIKREGRVVRSTARRHFCKHCGSALWAWDEQWPELLHPHASAIDTPLPVPPERNHILLDSRASWAIPSDGPGEHHFEHYPDQSLEQWHRAHGLLSGKR